MAVGGSIGQFDIWLNDKLLAFETDENVFGSYIRGILEGEESPDEKKEALESILSEMTENDISKLSQEIFEKWKFFNTEEGLAAGSVLEAAEDVDVKLARLMESQARATTVRSNTYTDEQKRIREAILSQYGQYSDEEGEACHISSNPTPAATATGIERNTNAALVAQAEREKREQSKIESQRKKDKDKEDREKQKQTQADKKEKRKTQKGERRR